MTNYIFHLNWIFFKYDDMYLELKEKRKGILPYIMDSSIVVRGAKVFIKMVSCQLQYICSLISYKTNKKKKNIKNNIYSHPFYNVVLSERSFLMTWT